MPEMRTHNRISKQMIVLVLLVFGVLLGLPGQAVADVFETGTPGAGTWTCPAGVTSATIEVWGAGGGGGSSTAQNTPGGGGGGGEYRRHTMGVIAGNYNYTVGTGGTGGVNGTAGGDTIFHTSTVVAKGGGGGTAAGGGAGGSGGTGADANFNGGAGGPVSGNRQAGGGGGGAGTTGVGGAGGVLTAGAAGTGDGIAGAGGAGADGRGASGVAGNNYGGGGGGGVGSSGLGANGAGGYIRITWTAPALQPVLTTPTATAITATSATLGATVTAGEPLDERGTVWGTSANPTGNALAEGGTTNSAYSHARTGLPAQTRVYYRGYASNPSYPGEYSPNGSFWTEPSSPASNVTFSGVSATGMTINWTRGTGGATGGVLVVVKQGSAVDSPPVDGTYTGYTDNTAFGSGTQLGTGNYVVYKGTGSSVAVTGLNPVTTYHVAVYEFAGQVDTVGVDQGTNYTTAATNSQLTPADTPTLTLPTATTITATTATLGATVSDNGGAAITARGTEWKISSPPDINPLAEGGTGLGIYSHGRSGLPAQTKIYYRGYATNSAGTGYSPEGSFYTEPSDSSTFINFTSVGKNGMTINWSRGSGNEVIVLMKEASAVDANPVDGTYSGYSASTIFGSGTQLGTGNYVVYKGPGTSVAVTGLTGATTYHVSIYELAGAMDTVGVDQAANYRLVSLNGNRTTLADVPVLSNPTSSAVLTTTATFGATIDSDGGDPITSRGTCWGTAPNPTGNCAAAFGTALGSYTYNRTGLPEGTMVYFNGYANNASAGRGYSPDGIVYMEPIQPTNLVLTLGATPQNEMTIDWTIASTGDSDNYLVVMREGSAVATDPADNTTYTANAAFGSGDALGSSFVVYKGTGSSVAVTGLNASTTYYVKIYAFSQGADGTENFNLSGPLAGNQTTDAPPAVIPTVTSPTASAVAQTTATLGATVTSNGGETLSERGTCWDLTTLPTANCQAEGDVLETAYSHGRALLPEGSRIYYRGYATNSAGTAYSPDGTIYTEPVQPAILAFSNVTQNSMKIDWTINSTGNADSVLVVMRATTDVATIPSDGSTYTANSAYGTGGTELGTSYVVYKGAGSTVTVSGLVPSTTYFVKIYAFAGNGPGSENYNIVSPLANNRATADPAPCFKSVPGIYLGSPKTVAANSTVYYTVTVTNYDSGGGCGTTNFTVDLPGGADTGDTGSFATPSVLTVDPCTISNLVEGGVDKSCVLEVTSNAGATNGHVMNTVVQVASDTGHATQSGNVDTTISLTYACDDCHGNRATSQEYPTDNATRIEAGATPGNHAAHVDNQGYVCTTCHVNNATSLHLNKNIEMKIGATAVAGGYYDKSGNASYSSPADTTWAQDSTVNVPVQNCLTTNCHGTASDDWGTPIGGDTCTTCHGIKGQASPSDAQIAPGGTGVDTAGHSAATDAQVGAHQVHLLSSSDYSSDIACTNCHVKPAAPTDAGHIDDALPADLTWSALADASGALTPDFDVSTAGACTNVYCHGGNLSSNGDATNEPTGDTPSWTDTTYLSGAAFNTRNYDVECAKCHGFPPKGYSGSHESMTNGDGSGCASCHDHLNSGTDASESGWDSGVFIDVTKHINGTVDASGCNGCHGGEDGATNPQYWPDGVPATPAYADNTVGAHDNHVLALANHLFGITTLNDLRADASTSSKQVAICAVCHPNPGAGGHDTDSGDSRVDLLAAANFQTYDGSGAMTTDTASSAYSYAGQNCTVSCHNGVQSPNTWTTPGTGNCSICHPESSYRDAHDYHIGTTAASDYLSVGEGCNECHVANGDKTASAATTTGLAHADGRVDLAWNNTSSFENTNGGASVTYSQTAPLPYRDGTWGTCASAACHNNTTTPAWNAAQATDTCTVCHTVGGTGTIEPTTGLHDETGTVSGIAHNPTAAAINACTDCHDATPSAAHINGTVSAALAASDFADTALIGTITTTGTPTCTSSCHADSANWARQWHENSDVAVGPTSLACAGCHGTFTTGFNTGVTLRHTGTDAGGEIEASHDGTDKCVTCHTYDGADTYGHKWDTHHDDGTVQITDQVTLVDNDPNPTVSCVPCHSADEGTSDGQHDFENATAAHSWGTTNKFVAGPSAACGSCHSGGVEPGAESQTHLAHGADRTDLVFGQGSWTACTPCHPDVNYDNAHGGSLDFNANVTYSGSPNGTCFTALCHNQGSGGQDQSNAWDSATQLECNDCHYYEATVNGNTNNTNHLAPLSNRHDSHFAKNVQCATCHTVPSAGDTSHISGTALADRATAAFGEAAVGGSRSLGYTQPNCTTNINGVGCHATASSEAWNQASGTIACTDCHTGTTDATVDPTSALHDEAGTVSGVLHHPSDGNFASCTTCHDATPSASHVDGNLDSLAATDFDASGNIDTFTAGATPTCNSAACHTDGGAWARLWHEDANVDSSPGFGPECVGCHGTFDGTGGFVSGISLRHQTTTTGDADGQVAGSHGGVGKRCEQCHVYDGTASSNGYTWATLHYDGKVQISDQVGLTSANGGAQWSCTGCHGLNEGTNDEQHDFVNASGANGWNTTGRVIAGPSASCTSCHNGTGSAGAATLVTSGGTHMKLTPAGGEVGCDSCHPQHSGGVLILNNTTVGINYTADSRTGFRLGGTDTTGSTEAEICWNCHASNVSEWSTNTQTATGNSTYNYGTLSQTNWIGATWYSAQHGGGSGIFAYKSGTIRSVHTANPSGAPWNGPTGPSGVYTDTVGQIRCSYCHDVHERALATGDTAAGKPYLRGTWMGNPYLEDGAPHSSITYSNGTDNFGAVPRSAPKNTLGGFQIDQNNSNPTNGWTLSSSAGICTLCHGTNVDTMNEFGTAGDAWLATGYNGHSNAAIGGTGSNKQDILNLSVRQPNGTQTYSGDGDLTARTKPLMGYVNATPASGNYGYGFRSQNSGGFQQSPQVGAGSPYAYDNFGWGAQTNTGLQTQYHKFSCSKCHNPHASRLPRLMITNCLDTRHNSWDDDKGTFPTTSGGYTVPAENSNKKASQVTSAQNCHRRGDESGGTGNGWNRVTPWNKPNGSGPVNGNIN